MDKDKNPTNCGQAANKGFEDDIAMAVIPSKRGVDPKKLLTKGEKTHVRKTRYISDPSVTRLEQK